MPEFSYRSADLEAFGPVVEVKVHVPHVLAVALLQRRQRVPPPVTVNAMIDTGATWCAFTPDVFTALALTAHDEASVSTASGSEARSLFDVDLDFGGHRVQRVSAIDARLNGCPVQGLIGRNVLRSAVLWYDGRRNQYSLEF